jgi:DNA-directed RNA polymerase subunit B|tara:strand:- start:652 stop:2130 length:1479 start_codon:yes stop_codon:yes gene_type:complete
MKYEALLKTFIQENGLVNHQISSFNDFIESGLQKVITEIGTINPEIEDLEIRLEKISVGVPCVKEANGTIRKIFPNEARLRDLTYSAPLLLLMTPIKNGTELEQIETPIGTLPIMLRSSKCLLNGLTAEEGIKAGEDPEDPGGYFIVNGTERVLVLVEDLAANRMNLDKRTLGTTTESVRIFSEKNWYRRRNSVERRKDGALITNMPPFSKPLDLITLMRALGMDNDELIVNSISKDPQVTGELYVSFEEAAETVSKKDALDALGKKIAFGQGRPERISRAERILDTFLLPHMGLEPKDRMAKAHFIAKMTERVIKLHLGLIEIDDKDHYSNKRLRLAGSLFEDLFRVAFRAMINNTVYTLEKAYKRNRKFSIHTAIRSNFLTERIQHAIATGAWIGSRQGISQHLDRMNTISALSHRRRVRSLLSTTQPHFEARDLHATHWGRLCPSETPEGSNIGLVKNLSMLAKISTKKDDTLVTETLEKMGVGMEGVK